MFYKNPHLRRIRTKIVEGVFQMKENDSGDKQNVETPVEKNKLYVSWKLSLPIVVGYNEVSQFELKRNLATVDKDSKVMNMFEWLQRDSWRRPSYCSSIMWSFIVL